MRPFKLRITYSASGIRRIEFPGTTPNGKRLTLVLPRPHRDQESSLSRRRRKT